MLAAASAAAQVPLASPTARPAAEPFEETRHGLRLSDPYRWMEDPAREAELVAWLTAATRDGQARLAALPQRAAWVDTLRAALGSGTRYADVQEAGGRRFARRTDPGAQTAVLVVRDAAGERVLFDPAQDPGLAIHAYAPAPDGRHVAVLAARGGSEIGEVRFLDTASGAERGQRFGPMWGEFRPQWLDGRRVVLTRMGDGRAGDPMETMQAQLTTLGADPVPVFGQGQLGAAATTAPEFPVLLQQPAGRWTLGLAAGARADARVMVTPTAALQAGRPRWRALAGYEDQVTGATVLGDTLYLLSTRTRPEGEVLAVRLDPRGHGRPRPVWHAPGLALTTLAATRDGVYVVGMRDGVHRLLLLPGGRAPARAVALPEEGAIEALGSSADGRRLLFPLAGWTRPRRFHAAEGTRVTPTAFVSTAWAAAATLDIRRDEAVSADGSRVPMVVIRRDAAPGPQAVLLEAYGSYGEPSTVPGYLPSLLAWAVRGHTLALCGTRGGNERGRAWHEAGRAAAKPNAHADYLACAQRLVDTGRTEPGRLAATGTSAGGLLSPVAALQRPDLFSVIVPRVAIANATRLEAMRNGPNQFAEMGDPRTEAGFRALAAQDAVLALQAAPRLPDLFVTVGLNDQRVAPWMGAKFAATALARDQPGQVTMLRADAEAGHGIGSMADGLVQEFADTYTFLEARLPPGPAAR
ncbi:hypothetical protein ISF6_5276 [Piscinibacter sakaiensis]|uniref:prolyl oligopeptidase n=2 Tax=Piscinibacter sakaiensis TaxID=1547922 RepID=A0A0K8P7U6_PISS1|nr:hypothetical protein ISF6_5276 [Piscinibacter sakaiensis]